MLCARPHSNCRWKSSYASTHVCTRACVHAFVRAYQQQNNGTLWNARERTMKLRPWYMLLLSILSAAHATRSNRVHFPAGLEARAPRGTLCCRLGSRAGRYAKSCAARPDTAAGCGAAGCRARGHTALQPAVLLQRKFDELPALRFCFRCFVSLRFLNEPGNRRR